jgi:hypothetical protein
MNYYNKYLKYKEKYIELKNSQLGGTRSKTPVVKKSVPLPKTIRVSTGDKRVPYIDVITPFLI